MKKLTILLAAIMVSMSAMAQVQFGGKVGFDLTNFWGKDVKHGMQPNYQIGALMEYKFSDKLSIAPEVVFASQGGKFDDMTFSTNYVNVPIMLKFYVAPSISIDFGPQVGFNVYSKCTYKDSDIKMKYDLKDWTRTADFGLGLGLTYNITENAFIQARYTLGLTKIFKEDKFLDDIGVIYPEAREVFKDIFGGDDCKNGNIQISFGWKF